MINKYEDLIKKLDADTEENKTTWIVAPYSEYARHVTNPDYIIRAFLTTINKMKIILLDGKYNKYVEEVDSYVEFRYPYILLIKDGVVAKSIDEEIVNIDYLYDLIDVVAEKTSEIDSDIDSFLNS